MTSANENNKGKAAAPEGPVNPQELDQLARLYNGFNLFHKGQMLTFLAKDVLIQSPEAEAFLPMSECEVGIAGTTIVMKLPSGETPAPEKDDEVGQETPSENKTSVSSK